MVNKKTTTDKKPVKSVVTKSFKKAEPKFSARDLAEVYGIPEYKFHTLKELAKIDDMTLFTKDEFKKLKEKFIGR